jgi:DNA invertase Pin-like site-specific DNA recombinase
MNQKRPTLRCAIYTRVSTEHGLEQEFNSLDNQREASEAYIKSQAHEGWRCLPTLYDDGGFSGGSMDRPALQRLLADIRERRIDIVVVYKVDRLTRSLADFAKLVELFDTHGVSFVSVTQAFNTTTSMGRLTLNVLLSFAQFEREVTGERIRDKIAASKRKGIRMGGPVPLGYDLKNKKLVINKREADRVRYIFRRYLELNSLGNLLADLRERCIYTKATKRSDGTQRGGIRFTKGPLAYLLKNRVYVGEIVHKEKHFPGDHEPIIDSALFDEVQEVIRINAQERRQDRINNGSLLTGRIFDDRGNRMTPTSANKSGARYRYYVSSVIFQARKDEAGSLSRVPAPEIEAQVLRALRQIPNGVEAEMADSETPPVSDNALVEHCLEKIVVRKGAIELVLQGRDESRPEPIIVAWTPPSAARRREIVGPDGTQIDAARPIRSETRARLVEGIAKARLWLDELVSGKVRSTSEIAKREACSERSIRMTMGLAFLSPPIVKAAIDGSLPNGVGITQLNNAPINWNQYSA